ncbi:MAG TPA: hypothetical protein VEZ41_08055 [Allosphingosinicella sp.]|nr:hypothetical protein [Allosphingosinicella sp.]
MVLLVAILGAVTLILGTTWIRAKTRNAELKQRLLDGAGRAASVEAENQALRAQLEQQGERLQVLERIVTDPADRTAREIEQLR